jgi:hypothetical protein
VAAGAQSDLIRVHRLVIAEVPPTVQNGGSRSRWDRGASPTSIDWIVGEFDGTGMTIDGESRIRNASIAGPVVLSAASLHNPGGSALRAIRMNADGGV